MRPYGNIVIHYHSFIIIITLIIIQQYSIVLPLTLHCTFAYQTPYLCLYQTLYLCLSNAVSGLLKVNRTIQQRTIFKTILSY